MHASRVHGQSLSIGEVKVLRHREEPVGSDRATVPADDPDRLDLRNVLDRGLELFVELCVRAPAPRAASSRPACRGRGGRSSRSSRAPSMPAPRRRARPGRRGSQRHARRPDRSSTPPPRRTASATPPPAPSTSAASARARAALRRRPSLRRTGGTATPGPRRTPPGRRWAGRRASWRHPSTFSSVGAISGDATQIAQATAAIAPVPAPVKKATMATAGKAVMKGATSTLSHGVISARRLIAAPTPSTTASAFPASPRQSEYAQVVLVIVDGCVMAAAGRQLPVRPRRAGWPARECAREALVSDRHWTSAMADARLKNYVGENESRQRAGASISNGAPSVRTPSSSAWNAGSTSAASPLTPSST